jgi:DNA-binding HxlR family transcriptional regulator
MTNNKEIPVHTSKVIVELSKKPNSFNQLQNKYVLSPSTLSRILKFLRSRGCIEVVIIRSETRDGMRKAYNITTKGKKMVPLFKRLEDTEGEILSAIK